METAKSEKGKTRKAKPLLDSSNLLISVKRVLDQILLESESAPQEIKQALVGARNACWERFKKDEETLNAKRS